MKRLISALTLAALFGSAAAANAETTTTPAPLLATPGMHLVLVDANTGKTVAEYVAILVKGAPAVPGIALPQPAFGHAFDNVAPLTIQQESDARERELELQGPPLHTP